jgi:hypothetical protein
MASQDTQNDTTKAQTSTEMTETTVRNVTGYIHFNKDDDLSKIFAVLHKFRANYGLKYSHHRDFIFFSVKSDCLTELAKEQPFRISHYRSKSEYKCSKEVADKLLSVRDSFVRLSWMETEGVVQFLSRTIGRVHNYLVQRIFKSASETYNRSNYFYERVNHKSNETNETNETKETNEMKTGKKESFEKSDKKPFRKQGKFDTGTSKDGFTKVMKNKSKYNNKKDNSNKMPTRGSKQKVVSTS